MQFIIVGIREIAYELFKSGRPWKRRIFRVGFRSQIVRYLVRKVLFKIGRDPKNYNETMLKKDGAVQIGVIEVSHVISDLINDEFIEDGSSAKIQNKSEVLSDPNRTTGIYRSIRPHDRFESVRKLAHSPEILDLVHFYLGDNASLVDSVHWITTPSNTLDSNSHEYGVHMDMGNWKWLNFFIYLNDVTKKNGAHCYVPGTHEKRHFLSVLERRMSRSRVENIYGKNSLIYVQGPAGTTLAEDTSNYHGGSPITEGYRHMLQINFSVRSDFSLSD
jgi:hypothetical protein